MAEKKKKMAVILQLNNMVFVAKREEVVGIKHNIAV